MVWQGIASFGNSGDEKRFSHSGEKNNFTFSHAESEHHGQIRGYLLGLAFFSVSLVGYLTSLRYRRSILGKGERCIVSILCRSCHPVSPDDGLRVILPLDRRHD